jgi:TonB family protein
VSGVLDAPGKTPGKISPDLVYDVTLGLEGAPAQTNLLGKQQILMHSTQVLERGEAPDTDPVKLAVTDIDERAKADVDAKQEAREKARTWLRNVTQYAESSSAEYGTDSRGRTYAQDVHEFVTTPMEKLLEKINEATPEQYALWTAAAQRGKALEDYWQRLKRLNSNREVWPAFLRANHMSADTAHSPEIKAQEAKLAASLAGEPTAEWATQVRALADAYYEERRQLVTKLKPAANPQFLPRESACPEVSGKTSGKEKAAYAPGWSPPDNYPGMSSRHAEEGVITLAVQINEQGCATGASIIGSSGFTNLDDAALRLYENMRFLPAGRDDKAVPSIVTIPVNYRFADR